MNANLRTLLKSKTKTVMIQRHPLTVIIKREEEKAAA